MRFIFTLLATICLYWAQPATLQAQAECDGVRYLNEIFPNLTKTANIQYGANQDHQGNNVNLLMDIYEPDGDNLAARPVMVLAHGGTFITGSKDGPDVVPLCEIFARMGYVTVSINYRLGMPGIPFPGPDSVGATAAVVRGVQDARAAVRWLYKDAMNGNTHRIDTNRIYIGGVSAGAFIGTHYVYLDKLSELPAYVDTTDPGLGGGLAGLSGNPGYSSTVHGVINICGALRDTAWMEPGDAPIVSLHGNQDGVVPYGTDVISVFFQPLLSVHGSSVIHEKATQVGISSCFYPHWGADHTPHVGNAAYTDTTVNVIKHAVVEWVCGNSGSCGYLVGMGEEIEEGDFFAYPNPATGAFRVNFPANLKQAWELEVLDVTGKAVFRKTGKGNQALDIEGAQMPSGLYLLRLQVGEQVLNTKLVKE